MTLLDISKERHYEALEISDDYDFQIHFRRSPNSCFINNYFKTGLETWNANMDIQLVLNERKAISYICAYLSKSEETCSQAMKHALRESTEKKQGNYEQMCAVAHAYSSSRECSVQEAVYHCLPRLWLRKIFPGAIYANTNQPSGETFKNFVITRYIYNMLDRYMDRPDQLFFNGVLCDYAVLNDFCYAEFLRYYYLAFHIKNMIDNSSNY